MSKQLKDMAKLVADDQTAIEGVSTDTRKRVLRMGKELRKMQKIQKKEQTETGQTWKEWCAEQKVADGNFPEHANCSRYIRIARYPYAYKAGMSVHEAYKEAGKWKANGDKAPADKLTIKARPLITIGAASAKLSRKIDTLTDGEMCETAAEQDWSDDEILGATDTVTLLRQSCNVLLRKLREIHANIK